MRKVSHYLLSSTLSLLVSTAYADPGAVQRNIEQNIAPSIVPSVPSSSIHQPVTTSTTKSIKKLLEVKVTGNMATDTIQAYFAPYLGKPVPDQVLQDFNGWAWTSLAKSGYLAYVTLDYQEREDGTVLLVQVQQPIVNTLRVVAIHETISQQYTDLILSRFSSVILPGKPLDLHLLENRLASAGFDLPIDIRANIQHADPGKIDLVLSIREIPATPGKITGNMLQANNYGLREHGRAQAIAMLELGGLTPHSSFTLVALKSEGLNYAKTEYEFPTMLLASRIKLWGSYMDSKSIQNHETDSRGRSSEFGLGLTKVLATTRSAVFKTSLELSGRKAVSSLSQSGLELSRLRDKKARLAFTADNDALDLDHFKYELSLTSGQYSTTGSYHKQELSGQLQQSLSQDGKLEAKFRFHGQIANTNLDSYDKLSLGGVNGVRAYSSDDGVGDQGLLATLDLIRHLGNKQYIGLFYDVGVIKPNKNPVIGVYNDSYSLQGAGAQVGGQLGKHLIYNLMVAKGLGSYRGYQTGSIESSPHNNRVWFSISAQY